MLSHHYKCTYFQLPDCSSQPSVLCRACSCLHFSVQHALPHKVLPTNYQVPPLTYQETTNPATEWTFQTLFVEHQPAFKYLLWLMQTHSHFQQAACDLRIVQNSPSFTHCPSYTQSYTPLLPCKTEVMSSCWLTVPPVVFSPSSCSVTTLKYLCRPHDISNCIKLHLWLIQFTRPCKFQWPSCLVLVYHTA